ncbi:helicase-associated domain-containing protein [Microbacterium sp. NIBRBAC000506063]|uniref:helicase-associated domain-containing protein n=1 Tax=Microbacterium sp. NIBRBAC000506063 TaxID=2734618 RepID=UPI001BB602D4|nr:helicase-associated domain-containing protein [Microbacterium sp. NIBRBAC000506063]QTV80000.1 helicase-associated domain-containing protein [Microbacterium sp. NIBRBAC000506063]
MSTHARPLAEWLAALDDEQLARLLLRRAVPAGVAWNDFFDAAEALLDPASIARVLPRLTRTEAAVLSGSEEDADAAGSLRALALVRDDGRPYPAVTEAIAERRVPAASEAPHPPEAGAAAAAHAAERAFTHVAAIADVLIAARESPLNMLASGAASATERRRFAEAEILPRGTDLDDLLIAATDARLAVVDDRALRPSALGETWLRWGAAERWSALAQGFRDRMPHGIRSTDGGWNPVGAWAEALPWDPTWPQEHAALVRRARMLGLIAEGDTEPEWARPLRRGEDADGALLQRMLPAEVDRIFLQNDLSAISPGPLAPALDVRLRTAAERESASQASSYRFTAESVAHALALGETEESLLAFLEELSLTGIPQPLRYLIAQTAQRHGLVQVAPDTASARTRIRSVDQHLLDTLAIDQALRPLGLVRDGDDLTSRVSPATAYWALTDARYPATLIDDAGEPVVAGRRTAASAPPETPDAAGYAPLIARLREHHGPDADAAWLDRALESAVQSRSLLLVEVAMPDGSTRELTLEATGLGGGRLRGRDRAADVERTLPVSSIRSARLAGD